MNADCVCPPSSAAETVFIACGTVFACACRSLTQRYNGSAPAAGCATHHGPIPLLLRAFGDYDPEMIRLEALANLPSDVAIGGQLVAEQDGQEVVWRVTDIAEGKAVLDGNHELAGQRLRFDCTVVDIRPATKEEITHGHVHGPGEHHHH